MNLFFYIQEVIEKLVLRFVLLQMIKFVDKFFRKSEFLHGQVTVHSKWLVVNPQYPAFTKRPRWAPRFPLDPHVVPQASLPRFGFGRGGLVQGR